MAATNDHSGQDGLEVDPTEGCNEAEDQCSDQLDKQVEEDVGVVEGQAGCEPEDACDAVRQDTPTGPGTPDETEQPDLPGFGKIRRFWDDKRRCYVFDAATYDHMLMEQQQAIEDPESALAFYTECEAVYANIYGDGNLIEIVSPNGRLKARYSAEAAQCMKEAHGIDLGKELLRFLTLEEARPVGTEKADAEVGEVPPEEEPEAPAAPEEGKGPATS